jgi:hypothetical protein
MLLSNAPLSLSWLGNSTYPKPLGLPVASFTRRTDVGSRSPKNDRSSSSSVSNVRLPTKAVKGGTVGRGSSSREGGAPGKADNNVSATLFGRMEDDCIWLCGIDVPPRAPRSGIESR